MRRRLTLPLLVGTALTLLSGCMSAAEPAAASATPVADQTIRVFAASSLTAAFSEIGHEFEAANEHLTVDLVFAGSSDLAAQLGEGAPADVFASANDAQMAVVRQAVPHSRVFARNSLTIVVEAGNPLGISKLEHLTRGDITLVACAPVVPCGAAAVEIQATSGVTLNPASEEANVSDVLGKVANGQADAGLVYVTDVSRAEGVESVAFAGSAAATTAYPIGVVASSPHTEAAEAFVAYVLGPRGQAVLASHGFAAP